MCWVVPWRCKCKDAKLLMTPGCLLQQALAQCRACHAWAAAAGPAGGGTFDSARGRECGELPPPAPTRGRIPTLPRCWTTWIEQSSTFLDRTRAGACSGQLTQKYCQKQTSPNSGSNEQCTLPSLAPHGCAPSPVLFPCSWSDDAGKMLEMQAPLPGSPSRPPTSKLARLRAASAQNHSR